MRAEVEIGQRRNEGRGESRAEENESRGRRTAEVERGQRLDQGRGVKRAEVE
jgi:hypothetical protein